MGVELIWGRVGLWTGMRPPEKLNDVTDVCTNKILTRGRRLFCLQMSQVSEGACQVRSLKVNVEITPSFLRSRPVRSLGHLPHLLYLALVLYNTWPE